VATTWGSTSGDATRRPSRQDGVKIHSLTVRAPSRHLPEPTGWVFARSMADFAYLSLSLLVFAVLALLVKGAERL